MRFSEWKNVLPEKEDIIGNDRIYLARSSETTLQKSKIEIANNSDSKRRDKGKKKGEEVE